MADRSTQYPGFEGAELDTDGVPRGQVVLDGLVRLLDLETLEENLFRGVSPEQSPVRVFGGQVAAQALVAAGRTVPADRAVHSLHAYFIRPGDPRRPIVFEVDRTRDGLSFTTRRVVAIQRGRPIFTMSASFQVDEPGLDHAQAMPDVPDPETLPTLAERVATSSRRDGMLLGTLPRPFDVRYVTTPPWHGGPHVPHPDAVSQVWFRTDGRLPEDPVLQVCVLTYLSDLTLLDSIISTHGLDLTATHLQQASLDHAMWIHRPPRVDDWILYETRSPSASGARGLGAGHFYDRDGRMIGTVVQEGLVRLR
jgi:acyl-CoA thioesterase II